MYKINNKNARKLEKDAWGIREDTPSKTRSDTQKPLAA